MNKEQRVTLALMAAFQSAATFHAFLPSVFELRQMDEGTVDADDVRAGEVTAAIWSLLLAAMVAGLTDSLYPLVIGGALTGAMVLTYEWALRS